MTTGLHHITGITGNAQANMDFYVELLGLRLVKRTVNHSDPSTLHLFYGDAGGRPGSILTFFVWPDTVKGRLGHGQASEVGLIVPLDSLGDWMMRLLGRNVPFTGPERVAGTSLLKLHDPDGLNLVLVGVPDAPAGRPWADSSVPPHMQVRGLHHVEFWSEDATGTGQVLENHLGFKKIGQSGTLSIYRSNAELGHSVYVRNVRGFWSAAGGVGTLHHVAFRAADAPQEQRILQAIRHEGLEVSDVREHGYFQSIYFREPGGSILEVATDTPGFALDEDANHLGERFVLPPMLESRRSEIEVQMPPMSLPNEERRPARDLGWVHRFVPGTGGYTLLLLHGTGGNELQLLPLGRQLDPQAKLISVRGRSLDEGTPRFFRRFTATKYDQPQLQAEADALAEFSAAAAKLYDLDPRTIIPLGYSNGANIALTSLVRHPNAYAGAILIRPVMPMEDPPMVDLHGLPVLVLHGTHDPSLPLGEGVSSYLQHNSANVTEHRLNAGHELTDEDRHLMIAWLTTNHNTASGHMV